MLRPIPRMMLKDSAVFKVCTGIDFYQEPTWQEYPVQYVHLQASNEVKKSRENVEVVLRSVLFVDAVLSSPNTNDYDALSEQSQKAGKPMRVVVTDAAGKEVGDYEVKITDSIPNVPGNTLHHWELGLV